MTEIYERLRHRFDTMASGLPKTESGSEIKLLKMIYTEKEAAIFMDMSEKRETPREAAIRLERDENKLTEELEAMARKGLLFRNREDKKVFYSAPPFVVGVLEFQIKRLTNEPALAGAVGTYGMEGLMASLTRAGTPHERTIPINKKIVSQWPIAIYDDAVAMINNSQVIGVGACTCRTLFESMGIRQCTNPIESCIGLDEMAEFYLENNFGREISKDEAISIITQSDEHGMVLQPFNGKDQGCICTCCGDCCAMLSSLKMNPHPADSVKSNYFAAINPEECVGCEVCVGRCQIQAIHMNDDELAVIDLNRCIGCGLCVTTCPTQAATLMRKPETELYVPPENLDAAHRIMEKNRGF